MIPENDSVFLSDASKGCFLALNWAGLLGGVRPLVLAGMGGLRGGGIGFCRSLNFLVFSSFLLPVVFLI